MFLIGELLILALTVYSWIIIIDVVIKLFISFGVINVDNPQAQNLTKLLSRATDPVLKPMDKYIPPIGGFVITPLIALVLIMILQRIVASIFFY